MSLLDYKNKFEVKNSSKNTVFVEQQFFKWTSSNFYRTSYNDMGSRSPVERKNHAIPGYKGFVPGYKNGTLIGQRYTEASRQSFRKEVLDDKPQMLSSTGFNFSKIPRQDDTLQAVCNKYGKSTIMDTAPNMKPDSWTTTARQSFESPKVLPKANFRTRAGSIEFDSSLKPNEDTKRASRYNGSGFSVNRTLFDGSGWTTESNLHSDMIRTSYRNQYNQDKPFHKNQVVINPGRFKKRELVYDGK